MKLLVLGATGGIGLEVIKQAVARGHSVTAFVRAPERLAPFAGCIDVVQGDLLSAAELGRVAADHDAVLSSFGPRDPKAHGNLLEAFAGSLTHAMMVAGVRRAIIVSVAFLFKGSIIPPAYLAGRLLFPHHVRDAANMEKIVQESDLDWTIVRPPSLTDGPATGTYRVREGHLPRFGFVISRADLADYLINLAQTGASLRKIVGVCR